MTVAAIASTHTKKLVKLGVSLFRRGFNASKCKTAAKMAVARIKLLRNKREVVVKQMRRDIALLLQSGQDSTARIRVEHVIREQNVLAANEFIELFCELIVTRLSIIAKRRECPADLKEGISSLIFAAPRCSEIPELGAIRDVFEKKYGKDFVSAATDLRPNCGVNRMLIDKLSVRTPTGEFKLKIMKEIAKEYQVEWDTTESEKELLKPPEELIEGPRDFVSATSLPVNPIAPNQSVATNNNNAVASSPFPGTTNSSDGSNHMYFEDSAAAAKAAAKCANEAIVAAKAAAYLANKDSNRASSQPPPSFGNNNQSNNNPSINFGYEKTLNPIDSQYMDDHDQYKEASGRAFESRSFNRSHYPGNEETMVNNNNKDNGRMNNRRHSYNATSAHSEIKFDESDIDEEDEEIEADTPPNGTGFRQPQRAPPPVPMKKSSPYSVHPKLPDYDSLAARFEALKYHRKSQP